MTDIEEIRKEVAVKHNVLLGETDPVLQLVTVFDKVFEQHVATLNAQHDKNLKALLDAIKQGNVEAKATAERMISQMGNQVSQQAKTAIKEAMDEGREEIRKDLRLAWKKIEEARKAAYMAAGIAGFCALFALGLTFVTVA